MPMEPCEVFAPDSFVHCHSDPFISQEVKLDLGCVCWRVESELACSFSYDDFVKRALEACPFWDNESFSEREVGAVVIVLDACAAIVDMGIAILAPVDRMSTGKEIESFVPELMEPREYESESIVPDSFVPVNELQSNSSESFNVCVRSESSAGWRNILLSKFDFFVVREMLVLWLQFLVVWVRSGSFVVRQ